jgi:hypothetical protein|tara:strand:+ start:1278 stop:1661 length:384 start_codon:yes stop_codon:yes gene_type:complete
MKNYPTLAEMGIKNPEQIERFSLTTSSQTDYLRIIYRRKKGSFLPASKRFEFGRASKTVVTDSGSRKTQVVYEISPFVQKAVEELEYIVNNKKSNVEHAAIVKDELKRLHQEMTSRLAYIESLIDEM